MAEKIREAARDQGLYARDLACALCGDDGWGAARQAALSAAETKIDALLSGEETDPPLSTLLKLAKVLDASIIDLIADEATPSRCYWYRSGPDSEAILIPMCAGAANEGPSGCTCPKP